MRPNRRLQPSAADAINKPKATVSLKAIALVAMLLTSCNPVRGCSDGEFTIEENSRLPRWFSVPVGQTRSHVSVTLTYYTPALLPDDAVLDLLDGRGRRLARVTGQMCWHPAMDKKRNRYGGFDPDSYPHYVIVRVDGTFEVIEHATYGAAFRISDDPELVQQARDAVGCAKE